MEQGTKTIFAFFPRVILYTNCNCTCVQNPSQFLASFFSISHVKLCSGFFPVFVKPFFQLAKLQEVCKDTFFSLVKKITPSKRPLCSTCIVPQNFLCSVARTEIHNHYQVLFTTGEIMVSKLTETLFLNDHDHLPNMEHWKFFFNRIITAFISSMGAYFNR